jgi:2-C-methyl-D-erythritol 4-phosphate cytidylyltransferase
MKPAIVILAAGSGSRFGHQTNKVWLPLDSKSVISHTISNARQAFPDAPLLLVISPDDEQLAKETIEKEIPEIKLAFTYGGDSRHASEFKALQHLKSDIENGAIDLVLIHDGARPLATADLYRKIAQVAYEKGGAIPTTPINPAEIDLSHETSIVRVQTPQGFRAKELLHAYEKAQVDGFTGTDTGACVERYYPTMKAFAVDAESANLKITYAEDLALAKALLAQR